MVLRIDISTKLTESLDGCDQQPLTTMEMQPGDRPMQGKYRLAKVFPVAGGQILSLGPNYRPNPLHITIENGRY